jgi:hypothetical protein
LYQHRVSSTSLESGNHAAAAPKGAESPSK